MVSTTDRPEAPAPPETSASREVVTVLPDLVLEITVDGVFTDIHSGSTRHLYTSPDEFLERHHSEILPARVSDRFEEGLEEVRRTDGTATIRYELTIADRPQRFECRLMPRDDDEVLALIGNITEPRRIKKELRESETRFRTLVNNLPGIVYRCRVDEDWTALFVSDAVEDFLGYPAREFMEGDRTLASVIHPEDRQRIQQEVSDAVEARRPFRLAYRMIDAEDRIHYISERGQPVFSGDRDEAAFLDGAIFDVTELHQMRQRVLVNNKMAAVGNLAAGLAHEINNPLTISLGNLQYVSEELETIDGALDDQPAVREALSDVRTAIDKSQHGLNRIRDIIEKLRSFTDAAESRADHVELEELAEWAIRRKKERLDDGTRIESNLESVPPVWASQVGLVQVIWNLLDNAMEAIEQTEADDGHIRIALTGNEEQVHLEVSDDGVGMEPEVQRSAFDPFYSTKDVGRGAGLGLFVCQGLVEGMDGTIDIDTEPGEGATVRVTLPTLPTLPHQ